MLDQLTPGQKQAAIAFVLGVLTVVVVVLIRN
jgi:hypothetical protein